MNKVENERLHRQEVEKKRDAIYDAILKKMEEKEITYNDLYYAGYVGSSNTVRRLHQRKNTNIESLISIAKALGCEMKFE